MEAKQIIVLSKLEKTMPHNEEDLITKDTEDRKSWNSPLLMRSLLHARIIVSNRYCLFDQCKYTPRQIIAFTNTRRKSMTPTSKQTRGGRENEVGTS